MTLSLFAGIPVTDLGAAEAWYERLLGGPPDSHPNDREAVWHVAPDRSLFLEVMPGSAGHVRVMLFFSAELEDRVAAAAARGVEPVNRETYANGVRKADYVDPDGNQIGFGGPPL